MVQKSDSFVHWFRQAGPYINKHRGKTFVIAFPGEAVAEIAAFKALIQDIALLNTLGVRVVLVHGARMQINQRIKQAGLTVHFSHGLRVTDPDTLRCVQDAAGTVRIEIEALLTMGVANSPMHGARLRVCSGNYVMARPFGVRDGIDFHHAGEVRRIDVEGIRRQLADDEVVLLGPLGYSPTGEVFNLAFEEVATETAIALHADKLIFIGEQPGVLNSAGELMREIAPQSVETLLQEHRVSEELVRQLRAAAKACRTIGRAHILPWREDGALLRELFTRDGCGTLLTLESYEQARTATIDDMVGLLELLQPLEEEGILVRRSRELLETEIEQFTVVVRDGMIIGCAALYPFVEEGTGELACVAVHKDYRAGKRGDVLLNAITERAHAIGLQKLFVLTTRTAHWFVERGFLPVEVDHLPARRKALYNWQRNSKVFEKQI